jgi:hypothetical protein
VISFVNEFEGKKFRLERGAKHGDPVSPNLFTCLLEHIFRKLTEVTNAAFILPTLIFAGDMQRIAGPILRHGKRKENAADFSAEIEYCKLYGATKWRMLSNNERQREGQRGSGSVSGGYGEDMRQEWASADGHTLHQYGT